MNAVTESSCPTDDDISAYVAGQLVGGSRRDLVGHLDGCERCRRLVSALAATEATLGSGEAREPREAIGAAVGDKLGRFELVRVLGSGSMGEVWAARDPDLDREVALKLLRLGPGSLGGEETERLRREAQAMARLHHPNVVAIHELGSDDDGRVFCAMELVDGVTLRAWLATPTPRPWRDVLDIARAVGRGIQAAHAAGLVHRDIKPENVMIARDGRPLVSDFGLARIGNIELLRESGAGSVVHPELTAVGAVIGTPVYMAPEQLAGGVADARSDQFAYCVMIWEALAGKRPFDGDTLDQLARAIREGPKRPANLPAAVGRVLARGLAAEPSERWPGMAPLVGALDRIARGPGRRRIVAAIGVAVAAAATVVVLGLSRGSSTAEPLAITPAWNDARAVVVRTAFTRVGAAKDRADATIRALDGYRDDWVAQHAASHAEGELRDLQLACFDRLAQTLDRIVSLFESPTRRDAELGPAIAYRLEPIASCNDLARLEARSIAPSTPAGKEAERALRELEVLQLAGKHAEVLKAATALVDTASKAGEPKVLARARFDLGAALANGGHLKEAAAALREAIQDAAATRDHYLVAEAWLRLFSLTGLELRQVTEAAVMESAVRAAVAQAGDDPRQRADLAMTLGLVAVGRGDFAGARDHFIEARERRIAARGPNHPSVANDESNLGAMLLQLGQLDEATAHVERAIAIISSTLGHQHPVIAQAEQNLASIAARRKDWVASEKHDREALAIDIAVRGPDNPDTAHCRIYLARALREQKRFAEARTELDQARASLTKALPPEHPELIEMDLRVAQVDEAEGKLDDAVRLARGTVDRLRAAHVTGYELPYSVMELARMVAHHDPAASLPLYDEAFTLNTQQQKERDLDGDVDSLRELAEAALAAKRPAAALIWFDKLPKAAERLSDLHARLMQK